jgi:glycosyltransferase involved in cell wall biosynthesis
LVAASYEDFGLTPLEAAAFGRPCVALRGGGFLDTIVEGTTGVLFDAPDAEHLSLAMDELDRGVWPEEPLVAHAKNFSEERFGERLRAVVDEEAGADG